MLNREIKLQIKQVIEGVLTRLRALNADAEGHPRDAKKGRMYTRRVLGKSRKFAADEHAEEYMRQLGGDTSLTNPANFVDALIRKSSKRDRRLLWRYRESIKLALLKLVTPKYFKKFLADNGGYKGCAAKYQKAKAKAARTTVH